MLITSSKRLLFYALLETFLILSGGVKCTPERNEVYRRDVSEVSRPTIQILSKNSAQSQEHPTSQSLHINSSEQKNGSRTSDHSMGQVNNVTQTERLPEVPAKLNTDAVLRGFFVFVGLSAVVVAYLAVRAILMRRKKTTVRKYGILASREDVEMTPLGAEDDEEDTTLFDVSNQNRP